MKVSEIFDSIQGEGIDAGLPTTFLRLAGCNIRCSWCDTAYAQEAKNATDISVAGVRSRLSHAKRISITGGEPLLQEQELGQLVDNLRWDMSIEVNTNGTLVPPKWAGMVSWVVDVKCPSAGSFPCVLSYWISALFSCGQLKFVVKDTADLTFVRKTLLSIPYREVNSIVLSPVMQGSSFDKELAKALVGLCMEYDCRLSLQLHKLIWGDVRGV